MIRFAPVMLAIGLLLLQAPTVAADPDAPARSRPRHFGGGVGGFLAVTGSTSHGAVVEGELYPGGGWGRYGVRAELRGAETHLDSGWVVMGLTYEAAATRPRLQLALHADAGLTFPAHLPVVGGGIQVQLWLWGPLAIGADNTLSLIADGTDTALIVASSMTGRIGF